MQGFSFGSRRVITVAAWLALLSACTVAVNEDAARPFDDSVFDQSGRNAAGTYVRVIDVGDALCVIAVTRDARHFIYDAGGSGRACLKAAHEIVGDGDIELLVISHSDVDHMQDIPALLGQFRVSQLWWTADRRPRQSYRKAVRAIRSVQAAGTRVRTLRTDALLPGTAAALGGARVTFLAGGSDWADSEDLDDDLLAKSVSLIVRLDYGESAVLLTGDTIGRLAGWTDDRCGFAEAALTKQPSVNLRADVLIAPNHGADTASSRCLIEAVAPTWVVFPSGHGRDNPAAEVAGRYLAAGIPARRLLRTDRGDDEGVREWDYQRSSGCRDQPGDDDIEILLSAEGPPTVRYLKPRDICVVLR